MSTDARAITSIVKLPYLGMICSSLPTHRHHFVHLVENQLLFELQDNCCKSCQQLAALQEQNRYHI